MDVTLKTLKHTVHQYLDYLWLYRHHNTRQKIKRCRRNEYKTLAKKMNIKVENCHVRHFDKRQCRQAIRILEKRYEKNPKIIAFAEKVENGLMYEWFNLKMNYGSRNKQPAGLH